MSLKSAIRRAVRACRIFRAAPVGTPALILRTEDGNPLRLRADRDGQLNWSVVLRQCSVGTHRKDMQCITLAFGNELRRSLANEIYKTLVDAELNLAGVAHSRELQILDLARRRRIGEIVNRDG